MEIKITKIAVNLLRNTLIALPAVALVYQDGVLIEKAITINQCEVEQTQDSIFDFVGGVFLKDTETSSITFSVSPNLLDHKTLDYS